MINTAIIVGGNSIGLFGVTGNGWWLVLLFSIIGIIALLMFFVLCIYWAETYDSENRISVIKWLKEG